MIFPPPTKTQLTVDDVITAGACVEGVREWRDEHAPLRTVFSVAACLRVANEAGSGWVRRAAGFDGDGDGCYGYGFGYGYGGSGYGDGRYGGGDGRYGYGDGDGRMRFLDANSPPENE